MSSNFGFYTLILSIFWVFRIALADHEEVLRIIANQEQAKWEKYREVLGEHAEAIRLYVLTGRNSEHPKHTRILAYYSAHLLISDIQETMYNQYELSKMKNAFKQAELLVFGA
jgi:hypothetical protein